MNTKSNSRDEIKLLVFSDLHQEEVAFDALEKIKNTEKPDYVLVCGDTSQNNDFSERFLNVFSDCLLIPGNWETKQMNEFFATKKCWIHEKRIDLENGLNLVGFGYSNPTPFGTYGELSEEELFKRLSKLPIDKKTILMLHCPPKNYFDLTSGGKNVGSESILKIINEKQPLIAFCGHIHEHKGTKHIGSTLLVKLPAATNMGASIVKVKKGQKITVNYLNLGFLI